MFIMTIHAYHEIYLSNTQSMLGDAFDYAINDCDITGDIFIKLFVTSSVSKRIEKGETAYLSGKSGIEAARDVLSETMQKNDLPEPSVNYSRSCEYWIGWAIAYYQWHSCRTFGEIFKAITFADLTKLYGTLHEADISKFTDLMDQRCKEAFPETNLKRIRTTYGCTQAELAKWSGVSLRSIQMYEQRGKNINKASVDTLYAISRVLGCSMEDLMEF